MFNDFKKVYPRREKWPPAERAFKRLSVHDQQKAIEDCQTRYAGIERCFVPLPATYLNARSWEDDPIPRRKAQDPKIRVSDASHTMYDPNAPDPPRPPISKQDY